jgi:hypothetical protein
MGVAPVNEEVEAAVIEALIFKKNINPGLVVFLIIRKRMCVGRQ